MNKSDYRKFEESLAAAASLYGKEPPAGFVLRLCWDAFASYTIEEFLAGLSRHITNPDNGQFWPKPADIIRCIGGKTSDSSATAWAKVDKAVRTVGTYQTVAFDDPLIHAVLAQMGGWIALGNKTEDEWPFVQKDFESRYRGFATRQIVPEYPAVLRGTADVANDSNRSSWRPGIAQYQSQPVLIGPPDAVNAVISNGGNQAGVQITRLADLTDKLLPRA